MRGLLVAVSLVAAPAAHAQALQPALRPLAFLVGDWISEDGQVQETGARSTGVSHITVDANGGVLLRRDHTDLVGKDGKPAGGFDQVMMIYPEADGIAADYSDGSHLIHYRSAQVEPGRSVEFTATGTPRFRLRYDAMSPDVLKVTFGMLPPGGAGVVPIASGTLHRKR